MRFAQGIWLYAWWGVVLLGLFLWWARRRWEHVSRSFAERDLVAELLASYHKQHVLWQTFLLLGVFIFSILALARPQWGFEWQEIKRQGLDLFIAVDTSKSMLTQDLRPNRLERAKLAVRDLLKKLKGDRVSLVAFSGDAFVVCPLTVDYGGFLLSLDDIDTQTVPRGGTNISAAISEALKGYEKVLSKYKVIIIITDGENLEGEPLAMARKAKEAGVKIYCVGMGTQEGELVQVADEQGKREFLKDEQGNFVKSRLNETLLQDIALTTGGIYARASGAYSGLDVIYEQELSKFERRDIEAKMEKKYLERFQIPLGLALLMLFVATLLPTRKGERG